MNLDAITQQRRYVCAHGPDCCPRGCPVDDCIPQLQYLGVVGNLESKAAKWRCRRGFHVFAHISKCPSCDVGLVCYRTSRPVVKPGTTSDSVVSLTRRILWGDAATGNREAVAARRPFRRGLVFWPSTMEFPPDLDEVAQ